MKLFPTKNLEKQSIAFIAIILIYCLYAGLFIYRTSFVIDGERFFSLFDDAMISMRYAKNLVLGLSVFVFFILLQTLLRLWYFGDVLPNTYYLKMTGHPFLLRITRGLFVALEFTWKMNWILFLLPFSVLLSRRDRLILLLFWVFLAQIVYSIYVGGDAWEGWGGSNRYICIVMPVFFSLFSCSLAEIKSFIKNKTYGNPQLIERYTKYGILILILISLINFNALYGPGALTEWLLIARPLHVPDNYKMVKRGLLLTKITNPHAKIAVVWAGAIPYFSNRYAIYLLGKNDKILAHENMQVSYRSSKFIDFYPGHLKWDYSYSIGQLKPNVVAQLWQSPEDAALYLDRHLPKGRSPMGYIILTQRISSYFVG